MISYVGKNSLPGHFFPASDVFFKMYENVKLREELPRFVQGHRTSKNTVSELYEQYYNKTYINKVTRTDTNFSIRGERSQYVKRANVSGTNNLQRLLLFSVTFRLKVSRSSVISNRRDSSPPPHTAWQINYHNAAAVGCLNVHCADSGSMA